MKKVLLGLLGLVVVAVIGVLGAASGKPDRIVFGRSVTIDAAVDDMAPYAQDLRLVNAWSPWNDKDPNLTQTWSDETAGVGAWYAWSGNDEVGKGKQTITVSEPGNVVHHLEFLEPFADEADAAIRWAPEGDGVKVTWTFEKDSTAFGTKVAQVFMDFEAMIGPDYEEGLRRLQPMVEEAAAKRIAAEEAAALAEAAAEAAAEPEATASE